MLKYWCQITGLHNYKGVYCLQEACSLGHFTHYMCKCEKESCKAYERSLRKFERKQKRNEKFINSWLGVLWCLLGIHHSSYNKHYKYRSFNCVRCKEYKFKQAERM